MKLFTTAGLILSFLWVVPAIADVSVRGYTRSNGTYVAPSHRSNPNSNMNDNWSTRGNVNPYTGKFGTKNPSGTKSGHSGGRQ